MHFLQVVASTEYRGGIFHNWCREQRINLDVVLTPKHLLVNTKKIITAFAFIILTAFITPSASGQAPANPGEAGTKIDEIITAKNKFTFKTFYTIGSFGEYYKSTFEVIVVTVGAAKAFGLRVTYTKKEEEIIRTLDVDEVTGMIDALRQMQTAITATTVSPGEYTEAVYETRSGVSVGFFKTSDGLQKCFLKISSRGLIPFEAIQIPELLGNLEKSMAKLKALGAK